jgi:hypothetical protein
MLKGNRKYYFILAAIFILIVAVQYMRPKPINWLKTYISKDKIPYGCYAIHELLENTYAGKISTNKQNFYYLNKQDASNRSLIVINDRIEFTRIETAQLMEFAANGNSVFLCGTGFEGKIKDTFKLETQYRWPNFYNSIDSLIRRPSFTLRFLHDAKDTTRRYVYSEAAGEGYFSGFDTSQFKVLSLDEHDMPVLISRKTGKGIIYLSSVPDVFTNLMVVNEPNRYYVYTLLSYLKSDEIIWDEYYKTYNAQREGMFKFIFGNDALYSAYSVLMLSIIFFMLFSMKRRQKPIPIIEPLENSTLKFVDVVSNVYYNSNNHKHIALEKITYFYYEIRSKFYLNTNEINEEFFTSLSRLSGLTQEQVTHLFNYCENLKRVPELGESDLIELNDRINIFKQKSIR